MKGGLNIELKSLSVDESCFYPAIKARFELKYNLSQEALINLFGNLSFHGKSIGRLEPNGMLSQEFKIGPTDSNRNYGYKNLEIDLTCTLDKKIISHMNDARRSSAKGDVDLSIEMGLTYLRNEAYVSYIEEYPLNDSIFPGNFKAAIEKRWPNPYKDVSVLLYAYPTQPGTYSQYRTNLNLISSTGLGPNDGYLTIKTEKITLETTIKSSDWIHDFLPKLGIGEYEIIEIPKVKETNDLSVILQRLEDAKDKLYKDLDIGASLASLRNSIREFKEFVKGKGEFEKLFDDNNNIKVLTKTLQENLYGAASRSEDSTSAHAGGAKVEGYEAESMIFMTYALYKMVFDRIKSKDDRGGE